MCQVIDSDFILIQKLKKKDYCTVQELFYDKNKIESKVPSVFIDVSKTSIISTVFRFPYIFSWENDRVTKSQGSDSFFKEPFIDFFNGSIEDSIIIQIKEIL